MSDHRAVAEGAIRDDLWPGAAYAFIALGAVLLFLRFLCRVGLVPEIGDIRGVVGSS